MYFYAQKGAVLHSFCIFIENISRVLAKVLMRCFFYSLDLLPNFSRLIFLCLAMTLVYSQKVSKTTRFWFCFGWFHNRKYNLYLSIIQEDNSVFPFRESNIWRPMRHRMQIRHAHTAFLSFCQNVKCSAPGFYSKWSYIHIQKRFTQINPPFESKMQVNIVSL